MRRYANRLTGASSIYHIDELHVRRDQHGVQHCFLPWFPLPLHVSSFRDDYVVQLYCLTAFVESAYTGMIIITIDVSYLP